MTLKDIGRVVEELGSETAAEATILVCFLIAGGGVSARSFPLTFESRLGSWRDFTLAASTLILEDFGDSTRALFLRLGFAAKEEALDVRADMIERVGTGVRRVLKFSQTGNGGCLFLLGSEAFGQ